jgi:hypothetical protein
MRLVVSARPEDLGDIHGRPSLSFLKDAAFRLLTPPGGALTRIRLAPGGRLVRGWKAAEPVGRSRVLLRMTNDVAGGIGVPAALKVAADFGAPRFWR